jgi:hypothetical protein
MSGIDEKRSLRVQDRNATLQMIKGCRTGPIRPDMSASLLRFTRGWRGILRVPPKFP